MNTIKATFVALMLTASAAQANIIVTFDPSTTDVSVGDTFTVDVLANAGFFEAFLGFDIGFNLDADIITLGSGFVAPPARFFDVAGFVNNFPFPPAPVFGPNILLATLTFTATSSGIFMLDLNEGEFSIQGEIDSNALKINVKEVSAPATIALISIAALALFGFRRKA